MEATVDYLVWKKGGAALGTAMMTGANAAGLFEEQQLLSAFALPLSQSVPGMTIEQAQTELNTMFMRHRTVVATYGQLLSIYDDATIRNLLVQGIKAVFSVDDATAAQYVARTEELFLDHWDEFDAMVANVNSDLDASAYGLPLSFSSVFAEILLVCGLFAWARRRWAA